MSRKAVTLGVVAAVLAVYRPANTCSIGYGPELGQHVNLPGDAEIRLWLAQGEFRVELYDSNGGAVPSRVVSHPLPSTRYYRPRSQYVALKPLEPLSPGLYKLGLAPGGSDGPIPEHARYSLLVVRPKVGRSHPTAVRGLVAGVMREQCQTGTNGDCSPTYEDCTRLVLDFEDGVKGPKDVYEVSWRPRPSTRPERGGSAQGFVSEPTARGRGIWVPIWWLDVRPTDREIELEVRAVDETGARSPATSVVLKASAFRTIASK